MPVVWINPTPGPSDRNTSPAETVATVPLRDTTTRTERLLGRKPKIASDAAD